MTTDEITRWVTTGDGPPPPSKHEALIDPESLVRRRRILRVLTVAAAGVAMFASGWGMWTFFSDLPRLNHWYLILPMFLLFDLAAVACAWGARINRLSYGRMGIEGWLVWVFATASGLMSSSDADGRAAAVRFAAPMVAAILFELLIRGERRDLTHFEGPLARIRRRILARLGLLDDVDQDDESAARSRMSAKLAALAYRVHETTDGSWRRRRAVRRYHRRLRIASVRMGFATNDEMIDEVRLHLDALYRSVSGTAPAAVADLNVWQSAALEPLEPLEEVATNAQEAAPAPAAPSTAARRVRIAPVRRPGRSARLAGRTRAAKPAQPAIAPHLLIPPPWELMQRQQATEVSALNGHTRPAAEVRAPIEAAPAPKKATAKKPAKKAAAAPTSADAFDRAFRFWQSEKAGGRTPSAQQIADAVGVSKATGGRYLQQLRRVAS